MLRKLSLTSTVAAALQQQGAMHKGLPMVTAWNLSGTNAN